MERFDTFYEQHSAVLSFRVIPGYFDQATDLLSQAARRAEELSIRTLQTYVADSDDEQKQLLRSAGFLEEARLRERLRNEEEWVDLLIYTLALPGAAKSLRGPGDYYGGRKTWQVERVDSSGDRTC